MRALLNLFKLRIGVAIAVHRAGRRGGRAPARRSARWQVAVLALAVLMSSAAAGAFNQYVERDLDARMRRTRNRPFVTGRARARTGLAVGDRRVDARRGARRGAGDQRRRRGARLPRRILLRRRLHGVAQAPHLVEHRRRRARRQLRGARRRGGGRRPCRGPKRSRSRWCCFCGRRRISGASRSPSARTTRQPACRCCRWWWATHAPRARCSPAPGCWSSPSLVPALFGLGSIYVIAAVAGGAWFLLQCHALAAAPGPQTARTAFHASLVQLVAVLGGAMLDVALR